MKPRWVARLICRRRGHDWSGLFYNPRDHGYEQFCYRCGHVQPLTLTDYPEYRP